MRLSIMSKYNLSPKKIIKILRKNGFNFVRQNGSHALFKNFKTKLKVIVPIHSKDLPKGTTTSILKDANIKI